MTPQKYTYRVVLLLCCLYTSSVVKGQGTCSSSALAPVFSQTFGQGANSSSKTTVPSGFTTNYSFQSSGALDDGRYIVTPRVQNSNRDDWAVGTDHTGNSNGNMFFLRSKSIIFVRVLLIIFLHGLQMSIPQVIPYLFAEPVMYIRMLHSISRIHQALYWLLIVQEIFRLRPIEL